METISLSDQPYRVSDLEGVVRHDDPALVEIVRLRYLSDPGFPMWDLSYAWGKTADGKVVRVIPPASCGQIPKRRPASALLDRWPDLRRLVPSGFVLDVLSLNV